MPSDDLDGEIEQLSDQDLELVRSALERHLDRESASTSQTLQVLDKLFPEDEYWTDRDAKNFGESIAGNEPGRVLR